MKVVAGHWNQAGMRIPNGSPIESSIWSSERTRFQIRPLASMGVKERKAATKDARLGSHFTQMYRVPVPR